MQKTSDSALFQFKQHHHPEKYK
ncbi:hypothetical protein BDI4_1080085 [Burkholderia diffusa]|nr:hypothetical protein BDI4_1080085 [Burkholderia diffusa]